jgi:hypothetical protein
MRFFLLIALLLHVQLAATPYRFIMTSCPSPSCIDALHNQACESLNEVITACQQAKAGGAIGVWGEEIVSALRALLEVERQGREQEAWVIPSEQERLAGAIQTYQRVLKAFPLDQRHILEAFMGGDTSWALVVRLLSRWARQKGAADSARDQLAQTREFLVSLASSP